MKSALLLLLLLGAAMATLSPLVKAREPKGSS
jgi:hypothetical protein